MRRLRDYAWSILLRVVVTVAALSSLQWVFFAEYGLLDELGYVDIFKANFLPRQFFTTEFSNCSARRYRPRTLIPAQYCDGLAR